MKEIKKYIYQQLKSININYAFMRWNKDKVYPYFVGEYTEPEPTIEDQHHEYTFILTGFTRGNWDDLEQTKRKIEDLFQDNRTILSNGSGIVITYAGSSPIPIDEGDLKKIQINLKVEEWRVS